jgi:hypothetical protein
MGDPAQVLLGFAPEAICWWAPIASTDSSGLNPRELWNQGWTRVGMNDWPSATKAWLARAARMCVAMLSLASHS